MLLEHLKQLLEMFLKEKLYMIQKLFLEILCIHQLHLHLQSYLNQHHLLHLLLLLNNLLYLNLEHYLHKKHKVFPAL
tara:strand:+ start:627 stop:857 length:231 start_codon:yes stop_codon:yes gene_type:complete